MEILDVIDQQRIKLTEISMEVQKIVSTEIRRLDELKLMLMKNDKPKLPVIEEAEAVDSSIIIEGKNRG